MNERDKWEENEASYFARCLLIPEDLLEIEVKKISLTQEGIKTLADNFGVESSLMALRIGELFGARK